MKLSVITINYNNVIGLKETIKSVLSQSYQEIEYIIIDGGSQDGSLEVIEENSCYISFWNSEPDKGIYNAMNKGIDAANGDYLLFINSGDVLNNNDVINLAAACLTGEDLIYGNILVIEEDKSWFKNYPPELRFSYFLHDTLPHPATFIKKSLFETVGYYNETNKIVSDWEFFLLAVTKFNCSYKYIPVTIANFKFDGISSRDESTDIKLNEIRNVLHINFSPFLLDYELLEKLRKDNLILRNSKPFRIKQYLKRFFNILSKASIKKPLTN